MIGDLFLIPKLEHAAEMIQKVFVPMIGDLFLIILLA